MTNAPSRSLLVQRLGELEQAFDNLAWAITQGKPRQDAQHALADHYEAQASDLLGLVHEARAAAVSLASVSNGPDDARAEQTLAVCQGCFNHILRRYYAETAAYKRRRDLDLLRRQRREWAAWVEGVEDALAGCDRLLYSISDALLSLWQEVLEYARHPFISVQATAGGQAVHIDVRGDARTDGSDGSSRVGKNVEENVVPAESH